MIITQIMDGMQGHCSKVTMPSLWCLELCHVYAVKQSWNFLTIYGGQEPSSNRVIVPARQATYAGGIHSLESIPGLQKRLKIRVQIWSF